MLVSYSQCFPDSKNVSFDKVCRQFKWKYLNGSICKKYAHNLPKQQGLRSASENGTQQDSEKNKCLFLVAKGSPIPKMYGSIGFADSRNISNSTWNSKSVQFFCKQCFWLYMPIYEGTWSLEILEIRRIGDFRLKRRYSHSTSKQYSHIGLVQSVVCVNVS